MNGSTFDLSMQIRKQHRGRAEQLGDVSLILYSDKRQNLGKPGETKEASGVDQDHDRALIGVCLASSGVARTQCDAIRELSLPVYTL